MKKFATIVLGAALVFGLAGQASATALETSGEYRGRFWYLDNYKSNDSTDFWDQRLRVNGAWKVSDTVKVGFRADILENVWVTGVPDKDIPNGDASKEIDFDQAYAAFGWGPGTLTVGKQDVSWGPGVYAKSDNRYRIKYGGKFGETTVSVAGDMLQEGGEFSKDDTAFSVGVILPPFGGWKIGLLPLYRNNEPADSTFWALDATVDGTAGPVKIAFEGAYGQGEAGSVDLSGLEAYVGAFMPLGPVNCAFEFAYAAGNDPGTAGENEGALYHDYQGPFNSFILFNNFDLNGYVSDYGKDIGVANAFALKASGTFAASKQLAFMGAVVWAQADQTLPGQDADMGFEIDALAKYALTENVTVQAGLGYLAIGDYFGKNADDPMVVTAQAVVTF